MSINIGRDWWNNWSPALRTTGKLNTKFSIPAFNLASGPRNKAIYFSSQNESVLSATSVVGSSYSLSSNFTIEMWIKPLAAADSFRRVLFENRRNINADYQIQLSIYLQRLEIQVLKSSVIVTQSSTTVVPHGQWSHVAAVFDGVNGTLTVIVNGIVASAPVAITAPLDSATGNIYSVRLGGTPPTDHFIGYMDEVRVYDIVRSTEDIYQQRFAPRAIDQTGLLYYFKFDEVATSSLVEYKNAIDESIVIGTELSEIEQVDGYPLKFGASFIVGQLEIDLGVKSSLKFPIKAPTGSNFCLVVRWEDDDGEIQRRKLFSAGGLEDIAPDPAKYKGEALNAPYYLEIWNIDGTERAILEEDLVLYTSRTTDPETSIDHEKTEEDIAPTVNSDLAEPLPLVSSPYEFNDTIEF